MVAVIVGVIRTFGRIHSFFTSTGVYPQTSHTRTSPLDISCNNCEPATINIITGKVHSVSLPPLVVVNAYNNTGYMTNNGILRK